MMSSPALRQPRTAFYNDDAVSTLPRMRFLSAASLLRNPLVVYSAFVAVSLLLLGSVAVASLPH